MIFQSAVILINLWDITGPARFNPPIPYVIIGIIILMSFLPYILTSPTDYFQH